MDVPDGFADFVETNYLVVQRALSLACGDPQRAEDSTQEAFARALRHWDRVAEMDRPVAWVYVVGANVLRRGARRERRVSLRAAVQQSSGPDHAERVATVVTIRAALDSLTARQRLAVVLRYLAELSTAEVGGAMRCAPGTVKSTLHTALAKLRVELEGEDEL